MHLLGRKNFILLWRYKSLLVVPITLNKSTRSHNVGHVGMCVCVCVCVRARARACTHVMGTYIRIHTHLVGTASFAGTYTESPEQHYVKSC